jgi:hypothetical protein
MRGARVEEIKARMRLLYPQALTILVHPENDEILSLSDSHAGTAPNYLLAASLLPHHSFYRS